MMEPIRPSKSSLNRGINKCGKAIFCCSLVKRNGLWMFNDGEEVGEPIGLRKRNNQVLMNMREPPFRHLNNVNWWLHMTLDLTLLAVGEKLRGLHLLLGTLRQNSGKPVSGKHLYQYEKFGGWSQTLLIT